MRPEVLAEAGPRQNTGQANPGRGGQTTTPGPAQGRVWCWSCPPYRACDRKPGAEMPPGARGSRGLAGQWESSPSVPPGMRRSIASSPTSLGRLQV